MNTVIQRLAPALGSSGNVGLAPFLAVWLPSLLLAVACLGGELGFADASTIPDPRHISNGWNIPSEGYADQPYIVKTDDGAWLCVNDAAPGDGYILTSSNSIHSSCNPQNFVAMIRACHEFGKYPQP